MPDANQPKEFWAHSRDAKGRPGILRKHLEEVGATAKAFAEPFGAGNMAQAAGLLHDLGKYSAAFQKRIRDEKIRAEHSVFGAQAAWERWPDTKVGKIIAWCVAGHHGGLVNHGDLETRWLGRKVENISAAWQADGFPFPQEPAWPDFRRDPFSVHFLIRMVFSCLVDADRLEAEKHFNPDDSKTRENRPAIAALRDKLESHLDKKFSDGEKQTEVNLVRAEVLRACREKAKSERGFFSLSVPTGGGKTLSSLAFALAHAEANGLRRVVYAIPFTSIIEQNAKVFRDALGDAAVLEHHCNYEAGEEKEENRLAAENWDAPVVAATNVQLFESLFAARASRCRKIHNLAQSVIVLDEAQSLPAPLLRPCLRALDELVKNYGASVVFCTATLPDFNGLLKKSDSSAAVQEIMSDPNRLHDRLARVRITPPGPDSFIPETLATALAKSESVLCVVNRRMQARETFESLCGLASPDECFHLSTWMHPNHRTEVLDKIKARLKEGLPCRVVSTSLVEAGVDLDFPSVWRATAGLDSIAQAAGRCNREGKMKQRGEVVVFRMADDFAQGDMQRRRQAGQIMMDRAKREGKNSLSPEILGAYFSRVFNDADLDEKKMMDEDAGRFTDCEFEFRGIEADFQMIDDGSAPILVPIGEGKDIADRLDELRRNPDSGKIGGLARKAQKWSASVRRGHANALEKKKLVRRTGPDDQFLVLENPEENYDSGPRGVGLRV